MRIFSFKLSIKILFLNGLCYFGKVVAGPLLSSLGVDRNISVMAVGVNLEGEATVFADVVSGQGQVEESLPACAGSSAVVRSEGAAQASPLLMLETFRMPIIAGERAACFICSQNEPAVTVTYSPDAQLILPVCEHGGYHPHCLQQWFTHKENCPICRSAPIGNIFHAIEADNLRGVDFFLGAGFDLTTLHPQFQETCLHFAAGRRALGVISLLIQAFEEQAISFDIEDASGNSALERAIEAGEVRIAKMLISKYMQDGISLGRANHMGKTALHFAAELGLLRLTAFILQALAIQEVLIDQPDSAGIAALGYAIRAGHIQTVGLLLEAGANPSWRDQTGKRMWEYPQQDAMIMLLTPYIVYPEEEEVLFLATDSSDEEEDGVVIDSSTDYEND